MRKRSRWSRGRPADMPPPERYRHGTVARYVSKCRCKACRAAVNAYQRELLARANALAIETQATRRDLGPLPREYHYQNGATRVRVFKRACPGPREGVWCVGRRGEGSALTKRSKGGLCYECRKLLAWNGLVWAESVRRHIRKLQRAGLGPRAISAACDVPQSSISAIVYRERRWVREATAQRILSVTKDAIADGAFVDAAPTMRLVKAMKKAGWTKGCIAQRLGSQSPGLQIGKRGKVKARTAYRVAKLYRELVGEC